MHAFRFNFGLPQPKPRPTHQINVVSTVIVQEDARVHEPDPALVIPRRSAVQLSTQFAWDILKITTVVMVSAFTSFALPIFIIRQETNLGLQASLSLEEKLLHTVVPYVILVTLRSWVVWNNLGHRMNGRADEEIPILQEAGEEDTLHVALILAADTSNFFDAQLVGSIALSGYSAQVNLTGSVTLGGLNYMTNLFAEGVSAFRKHEAIRRKHGQQITPFFKQKFVALLICHRPEYFGVLLREVLPIIAGIIRAQVTTQAATALLPSTLSSHELQLIRVSLGLMTYWSSAYFMRFELVQIQDTLHAQGTSFEISNTLSRSPLTALRCVGKMSSGEILIDALRKLRLSTRSSVNVCLAFAALGMIALLQKALHYVSSDNAAAVRDGQEGIVMSYYLGQEEAIRFAPKIEVVITCTAITLGVIGVFARSATLHKQARQKNLHQIASGLDEEHATPVIEMVSH